MMLEEPAQIIQRVLNRYESGHLLIFTLRFLRRIAKDGTDAGKDQHLIGIPPKRSYARLHVPVEFLRFLQRVMPGEDGIRLLGGIVFSDL
ncbi:hypothetical protein D3C87_1691180 [compost metagenome]